MFIMKDKKKTDTIQREQIKQEADSLQRLFIKKGKRRWQTLFNFNNLKKGLHENDGMANNLGVHKLQRQHINNKILKLVKQTFKLQCEQINSKDSMTNPHPKTVQQGQRHGKQIQIIKVSRDTFHFPWKRKFSI